MSNHNSSERRPVIVLSNRSKKRLVWVYAFLACFFEVTAFSIFGLTSVYGVFLTIISIGLFVVAFSFYQASK